MKWSDGIATVSCDGEDIKLTVHGDSHSARGIADALARTFPNDIGYRDVASALRKACDEVEGEVPA